MRWLGYTGAPECGQARKKEEQRGYQISYLLHSLPCIACPHVPHTTTFNSIVDLVVSCGRKDLKYLLENAGRNAMYMSHIGLLGFVEALSNWAGESILRCLQNASYYIIMVNVQYVWILQLWRSCHYFVTGRKVAHQWNTF